MFRPVIILILLFVLPSVNGQTPLQYNLRKGETFTIKQESVQETVRSMGGESQKITATVNAILQFRVLAAGTESFQIEVAYKDLEMMVNSNLEGQLFHIDASNMDEDNPQSRIFQSLLNNSVKISMNPKGDVIQVSGGDILIEKMLEASGAEDELSREQLSATIQKDFGPEALAATFEQMTYIYPAKAMNVGDSWDNSYTGTTEVNTHWTFTGLSNGQTSIKGKAQVQVHSMEPEAEMSLQGQRETQLTADQATGFILAMKVTDHSEGNTTLVGWEDEKIPTTIVATTTYKRIKHTHVQ